MTGYTRRSVLSIAFLGFPLSLFGTDFSLAAKGQSARSAERQKKKALGRLKRRLKTRNGKNAWYVFKFQHFVGQVKSSRSASRRSLSFRTKTTTKWKKVQGVDAAAELVYAFLSDRTPGVKNFDYRVFSSQAEADALYLRFATDGQKQGKQKK